MADSDTHNSLVGKLAPSFTLPNYDGEPFTFVPGEKGIPAAIFVYPAAQSFGCTQQACQFRDAVAEKDTFAPGKVQIIGLSADTVEKQKQFVEEQKLTYPVLSDTDKRVIKELKVGRGLGGLAPVGRVTYIIDKKGIVRATYGSTLNYGSHSVFVEKHLRVLDKEDAAAVQEDAAAVQEDAAAVQEDAAAVQGDAAAVQGDAAAVQGDAAAVQEDAAAVQGDAAAVQEDAAAVQGDAAAVQEPTPTTSAPPAQKL